MTPQLEYLLQTFMLHRLVDLGLGNEKLADHLRDEMDYTWRRMSSEQIQQVDEVGARLNSERDVDTAVLTGRIEELDQIMQHLAKQIRNDAGNSPR